jgi:hypothetical protein
VEKLQIKTRELKLPLNDFFSAEISISSEYGNSPEQWIHVTFYDDVPSVEFN